MKWSAYLFAALLVSIFASICGAQDDIVHSKILKAVMTKPRVVKLTTNQRAALVKRSGDGFASSSQVVTLSPKTMIISNRASMLMHFCTLFWPAVDSAYFEKSATVSPQVDYRIKVDPGVKFVIITAGVRTDGMGMKTWDFNFRRANTGQNSTNQQAKTGGANQPASVVFTPAASGWWEGKLTTPSEGAFALDYLEFTLVR